MKKKAKAIEKQEKDYQELLQKRKRAVLVSKYDGTAGEVVSAGEYKGNTVTGDTLMVIRDEKNFLIQAEDGEGMRYNMTVTIGLGSTSDDIVHRIKGKVISTENLFDVDVQQNEDSENNMDTSAQLIQISEADRKKYAFDKYNLFISGSRLKVEDALIVDASAVYEEEKNDETKLYVYVVEKEKLHKRYIVSNYRQEKYFLVNQGLQEGQTLAILSK